MKRENEILGIFSAVGTLALLSLIAWNCGAFGVVFRDIPSFLLGRVAEITDSHTTFLAMFPVIFAVVVLDLPSTAGAAFVQALLLGASGKHAVADTFKKMTHGNHFFTFFVATTLEELFARWLFLGQLTKIPVLSGPIGFYVLFLVGNGIWSLAHLSNFKKQQDQKALRALPQFVSGIFFSYVFVKYGLLAAILTHFASNAVIFATHRIQRINAIDLLIVGYGALCAGTSYSWMKRPVSEILPWLKENPTFGLPGWEFWDYVKVSVFLSGCGVVIFGLLLYDRGLAEKAKPKEKLTAKTTVMAYAIALPLLLVCGYGIYAFAGLFVDSVSYRVLALSVVISFFQQGASGSSIARTFWSTLPRIYIAICIWQAIGLWAMPSFILIESLALWPLMLLRKFDD